MTRRCAECSEELSRDPWGYFYCGKCGKAEKTKLHSSRDAPLADGTPQASPRTERQILEEILTTLKEMKKQEADYWETWKKAKKREEVR